MDKEELRDDLKDMVKTLYDESCIMEGEPVANPIEFAKRLNGMLNKSFNKPDA
jgi:HSP90 family molecular chaperone